VIQIFQGEHQIFENEDDAQVDQEHDGDDQSGLNDVFPKLEYQQSKNPVKQDGTYHNQNEPGFSPGIKTQADYRKKTFWSLRLKAKNPIIENDHHGKKQKYKYQ
jgi:hypothetical protein